MKLLAAGSILFLCMAAFCVGALAEDAPVLHIKVPPGIDADRMLVLSAQYGQGLTLGQARREKGEADFTAAIGEATKSVKLLIYYPGCKIVTAEMASADASEPFTPLFEKLPTSVITLKLTLSDGTPLADRKVFLRQSIPDMEYFGYFDGMVLSELAAAPASGTTDKAGRVTLQAPALLDDPLFAKLKVTPGFSMRLDEDRLSAWDYNLSPDFIAAQDNYAQPIVVKLVYRSKISGKVQQSFLQRNGIDVPMGQSTQAGGYPDYAIWFEADHKGGGQGVGVQADGSFSMTLPPGAYDLSIQVRRGPVTEWKTCSVRKGFVLGENEDKTITVR